MARPRTFETLEPPADMSWELFTKIVDQMPNVARVVMHGVGEPMLVKNLPNMIFAISKARGTYVLFNTNGTLMQPKRFDELIDTGLDELRVSLDAAHCDSMRRVRGKDFFNRIVRDVGKFVAYQKQVGATTPRVSLWLTGLKETVEQLPAFMRLAAQMGIREVHCSASFSTSKATAWRTPRNSLFEATQEHEHQAIEAAQTVAAESLGSCSTPPARQSPASASSGRMTTPGPHAAGRGPSCILPPTVGHSPAVSPPSLSPRLLATTRSATRRSRT